MSGDKLKKSIPLLTIRARDPGLVPSRDAIAAMALVNKKPERYTVKLRMKPAGPFNTSRSVVKDLGFTPEQEVSWAKFLDGINQFNEIGFRQSLHFKMFVEDRLDAELRTAIASRASAWRNQNRKNSSTVSSLQKAEARGGSYYRRVKTATGYRYFYEEDQYKNSTHRHISGEKAKSSRISKAVAAKLQEYGKDGCDIKELKPLASKLGVKDVANFLKKACGKQGPVVYKNGKFFIKSKKKTGKQESRK